MTYKIKSKKVKIIKVDLNNLDSLKNAEKRKFKLECKGYCPKSAQSIGYEKYKLFYEKENDI